MTCVCVCCWVLVFSKFLRKKTHFLSLPSVFGHKDSARDSSRHITIIQLIRSEYVCTIPPPRAPRAMGTNAPRAAGCRPACWACSRLPLAAHTFPSGGMPRQAGSSSSSKKRNSAEIRCSITSSTTIDSCASAPGATAATTRTSRRESHPRQRSSKTDMRLCDPVCVRTPRPDHVLFVRPPLSLDPCSCRPLSSKTSSRPPSSHLRNPIFRGRVVRVREPRDRVLDPSHRLSRQRLATDHHHAPPAPAHTKTQPRIFRAWNRESQLSLPFSDCQLRL